MNYRILVLSFVLLFGANEVLCQTKLDDKLVRLEEKLYERKNAIYQEINPLKLKKLEKMGIKTSNFNFSKKDDRKQINLFFKTKKEKKGFLGGAITLNILGAALVGIGSYSIYENRNSSVAASIFVAVLGLGFNGVSVPLHLTAKKKRKDFFEMKNSLMNFSGF